jgi:hypothetical protein
MPMILPETLQWEEQSQVSEVVKEHMFHLHTFGPCAVLNAAKFQGAALICVPAIVMHFY